MKKSFIFITGILLSTQGYSQYTSGISVATSDEASAILVNPAGLGVEKGSFLLFSMKLEEKNKHWNLLLSAHSLGFGYARYERDVQDFNLSSGFRMSGNLYAGFRNRWQKSPEWTIYSIDGGFLFRPKDFLSIGGVVENINEPEYGSGVKILKRYIGGVGLRPFGDRITLFAEAEGERKSEDITMSYGAELELVDGVVLSGRFKDEDDFSVGIGLNFTYSSIGYNFVNRDTSHFIHLSSSSEIQRTVFKKKKIVEIDLSGEIEDMPKGFSLFGRSSKGLNNKLKEIERARVDKTVKGVLFKIKNLRAGFGTFQELRNEIKKLKKEKKVVVYFEYGCDVGDLYLASCADRIVVTPMSDLWMVGPYFKVYMMKEMFGKLGVEFEGSRAGKYKSAFEPLTRDTLSDEAREQYQSVVDDFHNQLVSGIVEDRKISPELLDYGLMIPEVARDKGLIDKIGFYEDAKKTIMEECGIKGDEKKFKTASIKGRLKRYGWAVPPKIAVLQLTGLIVTGKSGSDFLYGERTIGSETVVKQIKKLKSDRSVKAIILRIDSGGGSGLASDLIWREVRETKKSGKPVVVSMVDVAGSGGYYIACPADKIVTNPGTITGSIGVLGLKPVLAKTYNKIGINPEIIKRGEHADMFSETRRFTEEELEDFDNYIQYFYRKFVEKVAEGRGLGYEEVLEMAGGRIYTGSQALGLKLVDYLGGLDEAVRVACELAKIKKKPELVFIRPKPSLLERLAF